jgi:hypothetical protein
MAFIFSEQMQVRIVQLPILGMVLGLGTLDAIF